MGAPSGTLADICRFNKNRDQIVGSTAHPTLKGTVVIKLVSIDTGSHFNSFSMVVSSLQIAVCQCCSWRSLPTHLSNQTVC